MAIQTTSFDPNDVSTAKSYAVIIDSECEIAVHRASEATSIAIRAGLEASEARSEADIGQVGASEALIASERASEAISMAALGIVGASEAILASEEVSEARSEANIGESEALLASERVSEAHSEISLIDVTIASEARSVALRADSLAIMVDSEAELAKSEGEKSISIARKAESEILLEQYIKSIPVSEEYQVVDIRRDSSGDFILRWNDVSVA